MKLISSLFDNSHHDMGFIQLKLLNEVELKIGCDKSILIKNNQFHTSLAIDGSGQKVSIIHPNGRLASCPGLNEIMFENDNKWTCAKLMDNGTFTRSSKSSLYFVSDLCYQKCNFLTDPNDEVEFRDLYQREFTEDDFLESILAQNKGFIRHCHENHECINKDMDVQLELTLDMKFQLNLNGFKITQTIDGFVSIERTIDWHNLEIDISPSNGRFKFRNQFIYATGSLGKHSHFYLESNESNQKVHWGKKGFILHRGGRTYKYDELNNFRIVH